MGGRAGGAGGLGVRFSQRLTNEVGTKGTFITGNPFGETNTLTDFELTLMGDKGVRTLRISSSKKANEIVKKLQKIGFKSAPGFPVYKFGSRDDFNKYRASRRGIIS